MSFIVQISPFVHLFTLKIVFHWGANPTPGLCPRPAGGLKQPPDPSPQVVPTFHFIPSYAPDWDSKILLNVRPSPPKKRKISPYHKATFTLQRGLACKRIVWQQRDYTVLHKSLFYTSFFTYFPVGKSQVLTVESILADINHLASGLNVYNYKYWSAVTLCNHI
jgi:hypothetical protein